MSADELLSPALFAGIDIFRHATSVRRNLLFAADTEDILRPDAIGEFLVRVDGREDDALDNISMLLDSVVNLS
jgi:hypothetical protein